MYTLPMQFDFSSTTTPHQNLAVRLHAVYCLQADSSYDVRKNLPPSEEWVLLRTIAGQGIIDLDGQSEFTATAGTLMYFKHQDVRRYRSSGDSWHFYWFELFRDEPLRFPVNTIMHIGSKAEEQASCQTCLEMLRKEDLDAGPHASALLSLLVYQWYGSLGTKERNTPYHDLIQTILLDAYDAKDGNFSVKRMAMKAGLCERRFRQVFEMEMGVSPKRHLDAMRMKMAEAMLRNTSLLIADISDQLGYCNPYHFSRRFQITHGISPSQYRAV